MRLPWKRQETEDEVYFVRQKKPKETLTQTAEKIIQKKMRRDPDNYGITAAERIKGISHPEPKTLSDFLKELREYKAAMREAGLEGGEGGSLLREILSVLPTLPTLLAEVRQLQQGMPQQGSPRIQIQQSSPQLNQPNPKPQAQPEPEPMTLSLESLTPYLDYEPQDAIAAIKQAVIGGDEQLSYWLGLLSNTTYEALVALITPFRENPIYVGYVEQFLSEDRKEWIEKLIIGAKKVVKQLKSEEK